VACLDDDDASALIDDSLDSARRRELEHHIDGCAECCRLVAALAEVATAGGTTGGKLELELGADIGRYRIRERIAGGGMGVVYRAYDPELSREVALKLVSALAQTGEAAELAQDRLRDEARALARIAHPNVLAVHDAGTHDDIVFLATEIVDGETLAEWLDSRRDWREVVEMFVGAGRGLAAAHAAGVVHRDFKPSNVLVGRDRRPRLGDFGLALAGAGPFDSRPAGTARYMSPEQRAGGVVDARSDQYSFAVALADALRRWGGRRGGRRLRTALDRARQPDPEARFAEIGELVAVLERAIGRRGRAVWIAAAGVAVAAAVALVVAQGRTSDSASLPGWLGDDQAVLFRAADTAKLAERQFADAISRARVAVDDAVARHGPLAAATARAHNNLGIALFMARDRAAAAEQFRLAIAGATASRDPEVANYMAQLAHSLPDAEAIPILEKALELEIARDGAVVTRLCDLAAIHRDGGRLDRARELAGRALDRARARGSQDDIDDATAMLATIR
jgi:tetratricopeptide (TPR) repeat protein